jgi:carbamoyltransferase
MFVQPAAGDAGGALGAALHLAVELGDPRPTALSDAALGESVDSDEALALAKSLGFAADRVADRAAEACAALLRGEAIGWVQGRFEWGPRALGHRSLLALPTDITVRERLNRLIKEREPFRPFAPAVPRDRAAEWFDDAPNDMTPFMTTVCRAKPNTREAFPAVCHVDGTARVQTVTDDGALAPLLAALARAGVPPLVLNTSLNLAGEPIVAGSVDALALFARRPIAAMFIEDVRVRRAT